jgi:hypothetical protein
MWEVLAVSYVTHYAGARRQDWRTPRAMFDALHERFQFDLDGASDRENGLLPESSEWRLSWQGRRVFCNPPWNAIPAFVELAGTADLAVLLVPARVNSRWFHRALALGARVEHFLGRPRFDDGGGSAPVDCLLLVFGSAEAAA